MSFYNGQCSEQLRACCILYSAPANGSSFLAILVPISTTYLRQLSCHRRPLKGFHSSPDRSSTPRLLWSLPSPGYAYRTDQVDRTTNLQFETERTYAHLRNCNREFLTTLEHHSSYVFYTRNGLSHFSILIINNNNVYFLYCAV